MLRPARPSVLPILVLLLAIGAASARAQVLVSKQYGTDTGLGNNNVGAVFQDSKGYLWFSTSEGLSRFDGRSFVNYGVRDGLPHDVVFDVAEDRWGHLWIATFSGLARLVEGGPTTAADRFVRVDLGVPSTPWRIRAAPDGVIWVLTVDQGLVRGRPAADGAIVFSVVVGEDRLHQDRRDLHVDERGRVWTLLTDGPAEVSGAAPRAIPFPAAPSASITISTDPGGRLLLSHGAALYERDEGSASWRKIPIRLAPDVDIARIAVDRRGLLWLATSHGVFGWHRGAYEEHPLHAPAKLATCVLVDRQLNVWASTVSQGVLQIPHDLVVTYRTDQALGVEQVMRLLEDEHGRMYGTSSGGGLIDLDANAVRLLRPPGPPLRTVYRRLVRDSRRRWWILSEDGLFYSDASNLADAAWRRAGTIRPAWLQTPTGVMMLDDQRGSLWIGGVKDSLYRVDLASPRLEPQSVATTPPYKGFAMRMVVDRSGAVWGADRGTLWKLRGTALETFTARPGLPETNVRALFLDTRGWLWIGLRYGGLSMTKNPEADSPQFVSYSTATGLRSDAVHHITQDAYGRMYLMTGRGLDRLDPEDGRVRHYDALGGPAWSSISWLLTARDGRVWAATTAGLIRFDPDASRSEPSAPPVYFTRVEAGGEPVSIPARSVSELAGVVVPALRNSVRIEFASLKFGLGADRYQYRLDGVDADWSAPTPARVVDYPRLPAGTYRFHVRSLNNDDQPSAPATASFTVLKPYWRTWWFITIVAVAATGAAGSLYRQRRARRLALERVRRQVAHDLHDEMGSGLAQIAVLSEVAGGGGATREAALGDIGQVARSLRESMTDIVWAVDPHRDTAADLVARMRQAGGILVEVDGAAFTFSAPPAASLAGIEIPPDRRRHLLLIFKEAMTNISRHAHATAVSVEVAIDRRRIRMTIADNGRGFDTAAAHDGHGLRSMRQRARDLGATLDVQSSTAGTRIILQTS